MKQIRKRLTYANVMSTITAFLVLGGATAFAAGHLGKNTVGTKQLKKNAVTSAKVKNNSLLAADFKSGQIPAGATGPAGPTGPAGKDAFGELIYKEGVAESIPNNSQSQVNVACDSGYHVVGGGVFGSSSLTGEDINSTYPSDGTGSFGNTGWSGYVDNTTGVSVEAWAFAICAKAEKVSGP